MSKALVSLFWFSARLAAAASTFSFALVVSLSCSFRAWRRFSLDADILAGALLLLFAPVTIPALSIPTVVGLLVVARLPLLPSPSPARPAERMRIPSESRTVIASAVVVNRVS